MRMIVSGRTSEQQAASTNSVSHFETEGLTQQENVEALSRLNEAWVSRAMSRTKTQRLILDPDSSESPVQGAQWGASCKGHFECVCLRSPLLLQPARGLREGHTASRAQCA